METELTREALKEMNPDTMCYVDCNMVNNYVDSIQKLYDGIDIILMHNILFLFTFYGYVALCNRKINKKYLTIALTVCQYYGVFILAFNLFYLILFIM